MCADWFTVEEIAPCLGSCIEINSYRIPSICVNWYFIASVFPIVFICIGTLKHGAVCGSVDIASRTSNVDGLLVEERLQYTGHEFGGDDVSLPVERVSFGLGGGSGYRFRGAVEEVGREACQLGLGDRTLGGHQDRLSDAGKSVRGDLVPIEDLGVLDERVGERDGRGPDRVPFASRDVRVGSAGKPHEQFQELLVPAGFVCLVGVREVLIEPRP